MNISIIDRWWDRIGINEVDMIAANEINKTTEIYEIKRQRKNINIAPLNEKVKIMLPQIAILKGCSMEIRGLGMENM